MRVLIVHESLFGTNRKIAEAIACGLGDHVGVAIVEARAAPTDIGSDVDLLLVGGPNHKAQLPTTATRMEAAARGGGVEPSDRGLREWLAELRILHPGQAAAVWDTRMAAPRILDFFDRSRATIVKRLRRAGARLVDEPQKFFSADGIGALVAGEEARARAWGAELAQIARRS